MTRTFCHGVCRLEDIADATFTTLLFLLIHCNSFKDRLLVDKIYGQPIFKSHDIKIGHPDKIFRNYRQGDMAFFLFGIFFNVRSNLVRPKFSGLITRNYETF